MLTLSIFVATFAVESAAQVIRTTNWVAQTVAGSGFFGYLDGIGVETMFNEPSALAVDKDFNVFVFDSKNHMIRRITSSGAVTTYLKDVTRVSDLMATDAGLLAMNDSGSISLLTPDGRQSVPWIPISFSEGATFSSDGSRLFIAHEGERRIYSSPIGENPRVFAGSGNPGLIDGRWVFSAF